MPDNDGTTINQQNLLLAIGRLEGKLDLIISSLNKHILDDEDEFKSQDERISKLENSKSFVYGIALTIGALSGGLMSKIVALL